MNMGILKLCLVCFRGQAFGGPGFGPRFDAPGSRYPPTFTLSFYHLLPLMNFSVKTCYDDFFCNSFCRLPSNVTDPMGDRMPLPNAWRPMQPPNMGPSTNAGVHGMGPPMLPRSGEMALPTNAVSTIFYSP